jgi:hypothetical protein
MFVKNETKGPILIFRDLVLAGHSLELNTVMASVQKMIDEGKLSVHKVDPVRKPRPKKKPAHKKVASPPKKSEPENVDVQ